MTALQALWRELAPGEARQDLVSKVRQNLPRRKFLSVSPRVEKELRARAPSAFAAVQGTT